jgi:hypothetical protein
VVRSHQIKGSFRPATVEVIGVSTPEPAAEPTAKRQDAKVPMLLSVMASWPAHS